jgi:EAL domain-containing protein (putative c-di-GMP-specific phosphodiesterase class I)
MFGKSRQDISHSPQVFHARVGKRAAAGLRYLAFHVERLTLERGLRRALDQKEFAVHYQAQVDSSYQVIGVEALIRWQHPQFGLLMPSQFIPLAEETGLIKPISEWILKTACKQLMQWHKAGLSRLNLAVNISPCQFRQKDTAQTIEEILLGVGLDPTHLTLELTESSVMSHDSSVYKSLARLNGIGVRLALDDFGKGFSSFDYLRRLPLAIVKVDESFIRHATNNRDDAAVLSAIIALVHKLRLAVVVEGLETVEQLDLIRKLQCDAMQGFIFSKPLSADQFERWIIDEGCKIRSIADVTTLRPEPPRMRLTSVSVAGTNVRRLAHG